MTAQAPDRFLYQRREFAIAGISGTGLFEPANHGLEPFMKGTACWEGYYCTYRVFRGRLQLWELHINLTDHSQADHEYVNGPPLAGIVPQHNWYGWEVYRKLRLPVAYTGGLLIGAGFIRKLRVHMGHAPAWKFRRAFELTFDKGQLMKREDLSAKMAEIRAGREKELLKPSAEADLNETILWVEHCFSRQYPF